MNLSWARSDLGLTWILLLGWLDLRLMGIWLAFSSNFVCSNFRLDQIGFKLAHKLHMCFLFAIGPIPGQFFNKILFLSSRPSYTFSTLKQHRWGPLKKPLLNPAAAQLFSYELHVKRPLHHLQSMWIDAWREREKVKKKKKKIFWCIDKQYLHKCIEVLFVLHSSYVIFAH